MNHIRSNFVRSTTLTISRTLGLLSMLMAAAVPASLAASLDSAVIGMFPKDARNVGYADLDQARQLPWYPQFEAQVVPVALYGFEQFLEAVQMRQTSPINQVAWSNIGVGVADANSNAPVASSNAQPVVVAIGDFDADTIKLFLDSKNIPFVQVENHTLYASGTGSGASDVFFTFLDPTTIAFGSLRPLERVLRVRDGEEDNLLQNETMMTLIDRANGDGILWGVLDGTGAGQALHRLVPEAAKFPQSQDLIGKLKGLLITVKAQNHIQLEFQATSDSPSDAVLISQLLQAGVLMRRYQANSENNSELGTLLDALSIAADGELLDISLELTNDQLISLIEHNTFSMKM